MNREQKAATIETLATEIKDADAVFAVDYRGISVTQIAELRAKLREADATFRVVKNSLTERAADQVGAESLKPLLQGPTALTFVNGDSALAAKAIADYARAIQLLPFKGGIMDGEDLDADEIRAISRLPSREVLYGQLVGIVASPVSGLVRTLSALVSGLAVALGGVREGKESGAIPAGEPPAAAEAQVDSSPAEAPEADATEADATEADATEADATEADAPEAEAPEAEPTEGEAPAAPTEEADAPVAESPEETKAEQTPPAPAGDEPEQATTGSAQDDDNQADASAEEQPEDAEATKED